jgi:hypothetical protein
MKKETTQTEGELTNGHQDKHPFRRKQQKAVSSSRETKRYNELTRNERIEDSDAIVIRKQQNELTQNLPKSKLTSAVEEAIELWVREKADEVGAKK